MLNKDKEKKVASAKGSPSIKIDIVNYGKNRFVGEDREIIESNKYGNFVIQQIRREPRS